MPAPKRRKQRVAIALEQQKQLSLEAKKLKRLEPSELIKQNQMRAQEAQVAKAEAIKPTQKNKNKKGESSPKKRRTK